jgi:hypothetical protein
MQERWAVLLREEPSSKDYREAVSSNVNYGVFGNALIDVGRQPRLDMLRSQPICCPHRRAVGRLARQILRLTGALSASR